MLMARRPFNFLGNDLAKGDPVVGPNGEPPEGRVLTTLVDSGFAYEGNGPPPPSSPPPAKRDRRSRST